MKTKLPGLELIILAVFFISFSIWAISKCNNTKKELNPSEQITQDATAPSVDADAMPDTTSTKTKKSKRRSRKSKNQPDEPRKVVIDRAILYATIDSIKLRTGPSLDSAIISKIPLFEKVYFLDEVTEFSQKINLGTEVADEPWVKVRTIQGHIGWVYGAGVHYHKQKRKGVL